MTIAKRILSALTMLVFLAGCSYGNGDDLLRLPKPPQELVLLQNEIDKLTAEGGEYAPPVSGNYRQAQQTVDLNGDGENEALVFMRFPHETTVRIYIFTLVNGSYTQLGLISEEADAVYSIQYADLKGTGGMEVLVGWQVAGGTLKALTVYTVQGQSIEKMLATNFSEVTIFDMQNDGVNDLCVMRYDAPAATGAVEVYYMREDEILSYPQAAFSKGIQAIVRIKTGLLSDGRPAIFVASQLEQEAYVTDVFTLRDGHFFNVSLNPLTQISDETVRNLRIYAADLNHDGVIDLPQVTPLPGSEDTEENADYWTISWRNYDTEGRVTYVMTTYHNLNEGWYLRLPEPWIGHFQITKREMGTNIHITHLAYTTIEDATPIDLCAIYYLVGDRRLEQATENGRFLLAEKTDVAYAAALFPDTHGVAPFSLDTETLTSLFNIIENTWITGEV